MVDDADIEQARELLRALYEQVEDISRKIEAAENRHRRSTYTRGAIHDQRLATSLRRDLYEAHRLIDGLHRRFPETLPAHRNSSCKRTAVEDRRRVGVG
jgi:predicted  nucleic acid-binding Zn-ribbon protein